MMIAIATSSMNWLCSGRVMNGLISARLQHIAEREQHRRDRHHHHERIEVEGARTGTTARYIAIVIISPCAKLTTRTTPKMTDRPSAISP